MQANANVLHLHVLRLCCLSTPRYGAQLGVFYLCTLCISTRVYIMHKSFIYSLLLEVTGTIIDDLFHSKLLTAFSGASASYSQNKPGSQCEVAVTCQSLAKCRYHNEYYVVVGGQYSNIMPLEWEYITYCSGASDSSSYHTLTTHCRLC